MIPLAINAERRAPPTRRAHRAPQRCRPSGAGRARARPWRPGIHALGGEAIEPDEEEVLVKLVSNSGCGALDVVQHDRALRRSIPDVVPPFLQKVRVSMERSTMMSSASSSIAAPLSSAGRRARFGRRRDRATRSPESRTVARHRTWLRRPGRGAGESRSGEDHRQVELVGAVDRDDQGRQLLLDVGTGARRSRGRCR